MQTGESQESDEWHFSPEERHIETLDVEWTSDDPDPVAVSRLKKSGVASGILEEQVHTENCMYKLYTVSKYAKLTAFYFQLRAAICHMTIQLG